MKLSSKGRYAVTAMVDIAKYGECGPVNLAAIAERQEISLSYLEQLFSKLGRKGLVKSTRGPGGGFKLLKSPDEIYIADIVEAADEKIRTTKCAGHAESGCRQDHTRCLTHDLWEELGNVIGNYLSSITLADVAYGKLNGSMCAGKTRVEFIEERAMAE
jgi:Rrf2 family iron-sulfur cluster assembly transcriptional regulator